MFSADIRCLPVNQSEIFIIKSTTPSLTLCPYYGCELKTGFKGFISADMFRVLFFFCLFVLGFFLLLIAKEGHQTHGS